MAPHHHCQGYMAMRNAASRHVASALGFDSCSPTAWLAPLLVAIVILTGFTIRIAKLRRSRKAGKPRILPQWTFEKAVVLLFSMPKITSIYTSFASVKEGPAESMWANVYLGSPATFWFVAYIAALEALDVIALRRAKTSYKRSLWAAEQNVVPSYTDEKASVTYLHEEEDPSMNEKMTIYEAARMPLPADRKTTIETTTETTCKGNMAQGRTYCQRLGYILSAPTRKYMIHDRAQTPATIVGSYNFSIFLRTLMLYTTLSVAAFSLCVEEPVAYLNVTDCGFLNWLAIAGIYGFRVVQLSFGKTRFMVRERLRTYLASGVRLV